MESSRIFIVEDEALITMELSERLEHLGYVVCGTASRGEEAISKIVKLRPDLVLMDIHLADGVDGIETAERLMKVIDVPVVYLTAYSDSSLIARATLSGSFGFLIKPFEERELHASIDMALYKSGAERQLREINSQLQASVDLLEQQRQDISRLYKMGESLQKCRTVEEAYSSIARSLQELFPRLTGFLAVRTDEGDRMEVKERWGGLTVSEGLVSQDCPTLLRGSMFPVGTGHPGSACLQVAGPSSHAYLCMPLEEDGAMSGLLHLTQPVGLTLISPSTKELAQASAETIELALANIHLREKLREQAVRDALTGLNNRRYMEEVLSQEIAQSARSKTPIGLMMLDLDHFKNFNDTYGHGAGDQLLREFGRFIRSRTRTGDIACRYGGEEFVVVLPSSPPEATMRKAEDICRQMRELSFDYQGQRLGGVTVSIGVAQCPEDGQSAELLLRLADQALYLAKSSGRDRVAKAGGQSVTAFPATLSEGEIQ